MINRGGGVSTSKIEEIVRNRLEPYTTEEEVQEIIDARVAGGGAELVNYLSKKEASNTYSKITHGHRDLATVEQVERDYLTKDNAQETYNTITQHNELFNLVESIMTLNFYTKPEIDGMVEALEEEIASGGGEFDPKVLEDYATIKYVDSEIAKIPSGGGGGTATSITNGTGKITFDPGQKHVVRIESETDGVALALYNKDLVEMAAIAGGVRNGKHYAAMAVGPHQEFLVVSDGNDGLEMNLGDENKVYCSTDTITITNNLTVEKNLKVDGQVQGTAFEPYATKSYVDEKIAEIPSGGEFDPKVLEDYATIEYVDEKIAEIPSGGGGTVSGDISVNSITLPENHKLYVNKLGDMECSSDFTCLGQLCISDQLTKKGGFCWGDFTIRGKLEQLNDVDGEDVADEYATKSYINNEFAVKDHRHERIETITKTLAYDQSATLWTYYVSAGTTLYVQLPASVPLTARVSIMTENYGVIETSLPIKGDETSFELPDGGSYEHMGYSEWEGTRAFRYRSSDIVWSGVEISYDEIVSDYAPLEHTHDDYYTKEEVDTKIGENGVDLSNYYTKDEMKYLSQPEGVLYYNQGVFESSIHIGDITLIRQSIEPITLKINKSVSIFGDLTVSGEIISQYSKTITHQTNVIGEIGTFCQTNGEIYDGYEKIGQTDCICQVVQAKDLTTGIVGIITSEDKFASHGDVLVKVVPGKYELGDILAPTENGYGKVATEDEMLFMMLNAIPRPKITSLQTGIDGMVACFLV